MVVVIETITYWYAFPLRTKTCAFYEMPIEEYFAMQARFKDSEDKNVIYCNTCGEFHKEDKVFVSTCGCEWLHEKGSRIKVRGCINSRTCDLSSRFVEMIL